MYAHSMEKVAIVLVVIACLAIAARGRALRVDSEPSSSSSALSEWQLTSDTVCDNPGDNDPSERSALADLFAATNGGEWVSSRLWLSNASVCNWAYVTCDASCRISGLRFILSNLVGSIPPSLGALRSLTTVNIVEPGLSGPIPADVLEQWANLTYALLGGGLTNSLSDFCALGSLKSLRLSGTRMSGDIQALECFPGLRDFMSLSTQISGTLPVTLPRALIELQVSDSRITGTIPEQLLALDDLVSLDLRSLKLSGTLPSSLSIHRQLTRLSISNVFVSGTLPAAFTAWTMLADLVLDGSLISGTLDPAFASWPLRTLSLSQTLISGELDPSFAAWNLTRLIAAQSRLGGTLHAAFSNWSELTQLILSRTLVSGACRLNNVARLSLHSVGELSPVFSAWTQLGVLDVQSSLLSGPLHTGFSNWRLVSLFVSQSGIVGELDASFVSWPIITVAFSRTALSGTLNSGLSGWGGTLKNFIAQVSTEERTELVYEQLCRDLRFREHCRHRSLLGAVCKSSALL